MMSDESGNFLYESTADLIRQRIDDRYYRPGERLPSVPSLAAELAVSTITIRRAIRDLTLEGIVKSRARRGSYVTETRYIERHLGNVGLVPLEEDMSRIGLSPTIRELDLVSVSATGWYADALDRDDQNQIYRIDRINLANLEPVSIDSMWFRRSVADRLANNLRDNFIATALQKSRIKIRQWSYTIEAGVLSRQQAAMLVVPGGFPILKVRYYGRDRSGKTIIVGEAIARSDRFRYRIDARP